MKNSFKFIDLFCGIGGFHQALTAFGGECVLASDIDVNAINVYKLNYGIDCNINVRNIKDVDIPNHDVLCAGFPCQTFSKAGKRAGFLDLTKGTLFFEIARILKAKHPKYFLLENVKNLVTHDDGNSYRIICDTLVKLGYRIPSKPLILSPHQFGIPQFRERVYIAGIYDPNNAGMNLDIYFDNLLHKDDNSIYSILDSKFNNDIYNLDTHTLDVLNAWDEFYNGIDIKVIGFPIWSYFFNTRSIDSNLPYWKKTIIYKNQQLYSRNKSFIDSWLKKWNYLSNFSDTEKKFEWQCGSSISSIWDGIIQIRPSGVRVKKPNVFQTLVALVQTPIIGKFKRKLSVEEIALLQSFPTTFIPDFNIYQAYKQFGNSVNIVVVQEIFKKLFAV